MDEIGGCQLGHANHPLTRGKTKRWTFNESYCLLSFFFRGTHVLPVTFETKLIFENVKISGNVGKVEIMNEKGIIFFDRCRKYERICNFFLRYVTQWFLWYNNYWVRIDVFLFASTKYFINKDKIIPPFFFLFLC